MKGQLASDLLEAPKTDGAQSQIALPPIVDAAAFLAEETATPREIVYGLLHQGSKMVLGGGSKTFKTWTLLDLAVAVGTGEPWLSHKTAKGKVLFLNFEIQPAFFQQRIEAVARAKNIAIATGQIELWNLRGHFASHHILVPQIIERVKDRGYALIILDPIYKLYGETDENKAGDVARLMNALERLAVDTGAAVAFGAHYSKGNQSSKESIDRISGSGVFARDPDTILNFTRHEEKDAFAVEATLRNFKPIEPFCVRWLYPLMRRDENLDPANLKQLGGARKRYSAKMLTDSLTKKPIKTQDWQKKVSAETGMSRRTFYELLQQASVAPEVKKNKAGQWLLKPMPKLTE